MSQVYDPEFGVISAEDADRINAHRREALSRGVTVDPNAPHGFLGVRGPLEGQQLGIDLPPLAQQDAQSILSSFPQVAGLIAQLFPATRGAGTAFAIPAGLEGLRQMLFEDEVDPLDVVVEGAKGLTARGVGRFTEKVGEKGVDMVTRALSLGGKSDAAIKTLPKIAIKEGAEMTEDGANAIRTAGTRRLGNGVVVRDKNYHELADAMDKARRGFQTAPNRITFWPQEAAANAIRQAPRELRIGRRMAAPFGVDTKNVIAPTLQTLTHLKLIQLANAMNNGEEPPLTGSRGPVRRTLR